MRPINERPKYLQLVLVFPRLDRLVSAHILLYRATP